MHYSNGKRTKPLRVAGGTISHEIDQKICISLYVHKHEMRDRQRAQQSHEKNENNQR